MTALRLSIVPAALVLLVAATRTAPQGELFQFKRVVDGVYAAIANPVYKINSNAVVIDLGDSVMVVDTHSKPSAARALMAQIKASLDKPVRYVVDTHFHWDHAQGNDAYPAAWPGGLEIISSDATREGLLHRGLPRVKQQIVEVPREIERLRVEIGRATDPARRAELQRNITDTESYLTELKTMQLALPTMTFDRSLVIHSKARTVQLLWLGKAHTDGDVFVYLPDERFLATGDALHGWTPFMNDSYPYDWVKTLRAARQLDVEYVVGGHGDVMRGKAKFDAWDRYFTDLLAETTTAYSSGASMADTVQRVSATLLPKHAATMPASFPEDIVANIQKVYRVVGGQVQ